MGKNLAKTISKNLSGECSQKNFLIMINNLQQMHLKLLKATGDLIDYKIADSIIKISKNPQQNNSEAVINEHDKEIPKERYVSPEERQKIIDEMRII